MAPLELSNPNTLGPEYYNIAKAQDKGLRIAFMYMTQAHNEKNNKVFKEINENTVKENEYNRTVQDLKMEIKSMKKVQTEKICKRKIQEFEQQPQRQASPTEYRGRRKKKKSQAFKT